MVINKLKTGNNYFHNNTVNIMVEKSMCPFDQKDQFFYTINITINGRTCGSVMTYVQLNNVPLELYIDYLIEREKRLIIKKELRNEFQEERDSWNRLFNSNITIGSSSRGFGL